LIYSTDALVEREVSRLLGSVVNELMRDKHVQEISANYASECDGGRVFADYGDGPMRATGYDIPADHIEGAARLLADVNNKSIDPEEPTLNCILACGARFHAMFYPASDGARFSVRLHHLQLRPLADFTDDVERILELVRSHKTVLIAGGTSSGKSTLLNSIIASISAEERLLILEDEPELQIRPGNVARGRASGKIDLKRLVFESLRDRPDRIIVGEVRGAEAYDMLDAFSTGHDGGMSTIHANSAEEALSRLRRLAKCDDQLIREAIDTVIFIRREPDGRRRIVEVKEL
jgi:Flp pilus assembly CpaF family ATPase